MSVANSADFDSIAGVMLSPLEHERYRQRRLSCTACPSCRGAGVASVRCSAQGLGGAIDLIAGGCPRNRWPESTSSPGNAPADVPDRAPGGGSPGVYVYGFPGLYAGASTELHHQIILWRRMGIEVHLIPSDEGYTQEPLYPEMLERGVVVHGHDEFEAIIPGSPMLGFCNGRFLDNLDRIRRFTHNTVFVNCMTWLFESEKQRHREGKIAAFLYQNDEVRSRQKTRLQAVNSDPGVRYLKFNPFFDAEAFPFTAERARDNCLGRGFTVGRISRQDADKFSADTLAIWEAIESPLPKRGIMLGFSPKSEAKIGPPPDWVETYEDQRQLSQQDFYRQADVLVQPMDTTENWPRIGLEAMASGTVLIVDSRGGWRQMVEHGVNGWLCDTPKDFIRYGTRMAHELEERVSIARAARHRLEEMAGESVATASWQAVLDGLTQLRVKGSCNKLIPNKSGGGSHQTGGDLFGCTAVQSDRGPQCS